MNDIAELFERDPLDLSKADFEAIIKEMRSARHQFNTGNMKAGSTKPKTEKQKQIASLSDKLNIEL